MVEFAFSILVESGSIAIAFRHTARLSGTAKCHCAVWHMPVAANPLLSERDEQRPRHNISMNIVWTVLGIGIVAAIAKWAWADERDAHSHLGFVSQGWLADHRLSQVSDPQR